MNQKTLAIFFILVVSKALEASESMLGYALRQGLAQGSLLLKAKKITKFIKDPLLPEKTKEALLLSQELISFADKIPMKTGAAYRKFIELENDWVTQVVVAAERDKLEIKNFEFPIVGSFPYKGYFEEQDAVAEEERLSKNFDVFRRKVPAFSSLGWFSDPLTSNLLQNEYFLVETLFHELVHLNFYFDSYSDFNEAFATWFSYKAAEDFSKVSKHILDPQNFNNEMKQSKDFDKEIGHFVGEIKSAGDVFYAKKNSSRNRQNYFDWIESCLKKYPALKSFEKLKWNNAVVLSFSTYSRLIPAIESYATKHKLDYAGFLKHVVAKGSVIAAEVEGDITEPGFKRCESTSP